MLAVLIEDASALVTAALGDVGLAQDLDPARQLRREINRQIGSVDQLAVNAVAHSDAVLHRLEMDIRRLVANRPPQQVVDDGHHVIVGRGVLGAAGPMKVLEVGDGLKDGVARPDGELDRHAQRGLEVSHHVGARRVWRHDGGDLAVGEHRHRVAALHERQRHALEELDVDHLDVRLDVRKIEVVGQGEQERAFRHEPLLEGDLADPLAGRALLVRQALVQLLGRQQVQQHEDGADLVLGAMRLDRLMQALLGRHPLFDEDLA